MKAYLSGWLRLFAGLGVVCIPFPFHLFPYQQALMQALFLAPLSSLAAQVWGAPIAHADLSSDSSLLYLLLAVLGAIAAVGAALWQVLKRRLGPGYKVWPLGSKLISYYLALQLAQYGFDKLGKAQFYLPEPNILYTPIGMLDQDVLYWSTMGISYPYNLFLGGVEVLAAALILFRPVRVLGLLLALGVLVHIVAINFSFDISVKLYACFLLFLSVLLLGPQLGRLYGLFVRQKSIGLKPEYELPYLQRNPFVRVAGKSFVVCLILIESLFPYLRDGHFNDDMAARPYLHGAYAVQSIDRPMGGQLPADMRLKRIFIHRDGYLIFQDEADKMTDFKLQIDPYKRAFVLTDYAFRQTQHPYHLGPAENALSLHYTLRDTTYEIHALALAWQELPVLQRQFHWRVDR